MNSTNTRTRIRVVTAFAALLMVCGTAAAQDDKVKGVINGRNGANMTVLAQGGEDVTVTLTPNTQVEEADGIFGRKRLGLTAMVPGLPVEVKGSFNAKHEFIADKVTFHGSDLKAAQDIQAGVTPTEQQVQQNQERIQQDQKKIAAEEERTEANKAAIAAANKRFGELGEYNILGEVTVLFGNDKVAVDPQYEPQLLKLAQQAKGIDGYVILVKGYASKVGSAALNEKLSTERAENVTNFLEQEGKIPLTNMLAPGAMGTSKQVASDSTAEGQAENRRVVVRILQNKGIAGT
jgi:OmpA-OmpF porin, OOP family